MRISEEPYEGIQVVKPWDRLDTANGPELEAYLNDVAGKGHRKVILDLSEVEYMASQGLRAILSAAKQIEADGGRLAVAHPRDDVRKVFGLTGVHQILAIYHTLTEAAESFAGEPGG